MYPAHLGKFSVPDRTWGRYPGGWVPEVEYTPEPPVFTRGAMNPWEQERQRVFWQAEEKAWVDIQAKQRTYRQIYSSLQAVIEQMNAVARELEGLTGKPVGLFSVSNIATLLASSTGNPYVIAAMLLKTLVFDVLMGNKKKKKIESLVNQLQVLQQQAQTYVTRLHTLEDEVTVLIQTGERIRQTQQATISKDMEQSETVYQQRQQLDRQRATVLRERIRQVATMPRPSGGQYANEL
jgi:hypothetical protein